MAARSVIKLADLRPGQTLYLPECDTEHHESDIVNRSVVDQGGRPFKHPVLVVGIDQIRQIAQIVVITSFSTSHRRDSNQPMSPSRNGSRTPNDNDGPYTLADKYSADKSHNARRRYLFVEHWGDERDKPYHHPDDSKILHWEPSGHQTSRSSSTGSSSTGSSSTGSSSTGSSSTGSSSTGLGSTRPASTALASTAPASTAPASTAPASTSLSTNGPSSTGSLSQKILPMLAKPSYVSAEAVYEIEPRYLVWLRGTNAPDSTALYLDSDSVAAVIELVNERKGHSSPFLRMNSRYCNSNWNHNSNRNTNSPLNENVTPNNGSRARNNSSTSNNNENSPNSPSNGPRNGTRNGCYQDRALALLDVLRPTTNLIQRSTQGPRALSRRRQPSPDKCAAMSQDWRRPPAPAAVSPLSLNSSAQLPTPPSSPLVESQSSAPATDAGKAENVAPETPENSAPINSEGSMPITPESSAPISPKNSTPTSPRSSTPQPSENTPENEMDNNEQQPTDLSNDV